VSRTECLLHHSEALTFAGTGQRGQITCVRICFVHTFNANHIQPGHITPRAPPPFAKKVNHSHTPFPDRNRLTHINCGQGKGTFHQYTSYMYSYARTQCIVSSGSLLLVQHSVGRPIVFVPLQSTPGRLLSVVSSKNVREPSLSISVGAQTLIILGACSCTPCNDAQLTRLPPMLCAHLWTKGRSRRTQTQPLT